MVEDVYARIALRVSRNGEMIVDNRTEIINHWETIQENIMATFGCDDEMKTFCENVREGLDNIDHYVKRNMIFFCSFCPHSVGGRNLSFLQIPSCPLVTP